MEKENQVSDVLGVMGIIFAILSFIVGMFYMQIIAILLAAFAPKKTFFHWLVIIVASISLFIDLSTMYMIINHL